MTDKLVPVGNTISDLEWHEIINQLVDEIQGEEKALPEQVIKATELMIAGFPIYKIAKTIGVKTETVRRWLTVYPTMAAIVLEGKKLLSKWRMSKLEQQFLTAIERSQEVLETDLSGKLNDDYVDPKILTVVAAQARYIIGLFAGQRQDITVRHELGDTVMKAKEEALSYLASKLAEQRNESTAEPIEAVYRIIDEKLDNQGPVLDEKGKPLFGELGIIDKNEDGLLCHICGNRFKALQKHLLTKHNVTVSEYEQTFMLEEDTINQVGKINDQED